MQELYTENYKPFLKEIHKTWRNKKASHIHELEDLILSRMAILVKVVYRFSAIETKIPCVESGGWKPQETEGRSAALSSQETPFPVSPGTAAGWVTCQTLLRWEGNWSPSMRALMTYQNSRGHILPLWSQHGPVTGEGIASFYGEECVKQTKTS